MIGEIVGDKFDELMFLTFLDKGLLGNRKKSQAVRTITNPK